MDTDKVKRLAEVAKKWFTTKDRNGKIITVTKDGAPEWISEMCMEAHDDMMPDDFIYDAIYGAIAHVNEIEDITEPELEPSVYYADQLAWLSSNMERVGRFEETVAEMEWPKENGVSTICMVAMQREMEEVYFNIVKFLDDMEEETEEETA